MGSGSRNGDRTGRIESQVETAKKEIPKKFDTFSGFYTA